MASNDKLSPSGLSLTSFGWAERAFAAFCMGIPFFLLVVDVGTLYDADSNDPRWLYNFLVFAVSLLTVPFLLGLVYYGLNQWRPHAAAFWTTMIAVVALYVLVLLCEYYFTSDLDPVRPSISQYASMNDAPIFGMLLTVPSMIMILSGFIFADEMKKAATRVSFYSIVSGAGLLGVVVCPYYFILWIHYSMAVIFFAFAIAVISVGLGKEKNPKTNIFSVVIMLIALVIGVLYQFEVSSIGKGWMTLFEAESVGLWFIGAHYIITSFERTGERKVATGGAQ